MIPTKPSVSPCLGLSAYKPEVSHSPETVKGAATRAPPSARGCEVDSGSALGLGYGVMGCG